MGILSRNLIVVFSSCVLVSTGFVIYKKRIHDSRSKRVVIPVDTTYDVPDGRIQESLVFSTQSYGVPRSFSASYFVGAEVQGGDRREQLLRIRRDFGSLDNRAGYMLTFAPTGPMIAATDETTREKDTSIVRPKNPIDTAPVSDVGGDIQITMKSIKEKQEERRVKNNLASRTPTIPTQVEVVDAVVPGENASDVSNYGSYGNTMLGNSTNKNSSIHINKEDDIDPIWAYDELSPEDVDVTEKDIADAVQEAADVGSYAVYIGVEEEDEAGLDALVDTMFDK